MNDRALAAGALVAILPLLWVAAASGQSFLGPGGSTGIGGGRAPASHLYAHATLSTDGVTINANGNYSGGATVFELQPPAGSIYVVHRLIATVQDGGAWRAEYYGGLGAALTNGVILRVQDDSGTLIELTDNYPIKSESAWAHYCYDSMVNALGAGDNVQSVRWTFAKAGAPIQLVGDRNERLELVFEDDLTGLTGHWFVFEGQIY